MQGPSVIINYCSNEKCFLDAILTQCAKFSDDIVVSYGSHYYDGTPEDAAHIDACKAKYPAVKFVEYAVDAAADMSKKRGVVARPTAYWHNLARWTGVQALTRREWVFVLDADEIPEGALVAKWWERAVHIIKPEECYKINNFWYFKLPIYQATSLEDSVLLIHASHLTEDNIFADFERDSLIQNSKCKLVRGVRGLSNAVMFHHYSFVRTRECLEKKMKVWAHCNDILKGANVEGMIQHIYKDANPNDIIHGYQYTTVYNKFGIDV